MWTPSNKKGSCGEPLPGNMVSKPEQRQAPLKNVPDDIGPILAIASITPSEKQSVPGFPVAISQVAIELYRPVPGGIAVGGRFSPASLAVPGMREYLLPPVAN